jgi:hypothetical protein
MQIMCDGKLFNPCGSRRAGMRCAAFAQRAGRDRAIVIVMRYGSTTGQRTRRRPRRPDHLLGCECQWCLGALTTGWREGTRRQRVRWADHERRAAP